MNSSSKVLTVRQGAQQTQMPQDRSSFRLRPLWWGTAGEQQSWCGYSVQDITQGPPKWTCEQHTIQKPVLNLVAKARVKAGGEGDQKWSERGSMLEVGFGVDSTPYCIRQIFVLGFLLIATLLYRIQLSFTLHFKSNQKADFKSVALNSSILGN